MFSAGSVTKQFTAAATMILVERARVVLDEKISKYLPNVPAAWNSVTVRHLLNHTSGIKDVTDIPGFEENIEHHHPGPDGALRLSGAYPLGFGPGDRWQYCNTGYILLGHIIEKVAGCSYEDFMRDHVFRPLRMEATRIDRTGLIVKNRASGYEVREGVLVNARSIDMGWPFSAGALITSTSDLAKWDAALYTPKILSRESLQGMWTPVRLNDGNTFIYGMGWGVDSINGHPALAHGGKITGYTSYIMRFPRDGLSVIVMDNRSSEDEPEIFFHTRAIAIHVAGLVRRELAYRSQHPIVDTERELTSRLISFVRSAMEEQADVSLCSAEFAQDWSAQQPSYRTFFRMFGPLVSAHLVGRTEMEGCSANLLELRFADGAFLLRISTDPDRKVVDLWIQAEL